MHLKNRFKTEDYNRIWIDQNYCSDCSSNFMCSLHHIYSTKSDSIYNSIFLCMAHHKKADGENTAVLGNELRQKYLNYTFERIQNNDWYINQDRDREFLMWCMPDLTEKNRRIAKTLI